MMVADEAGGDATSGPVEAAEAKAVSQGVAGEEEPDAKRRRTAGDGGGVSEGASGRAAAEAPKAPESLALSEEEEDKTHYEVLGVGVKATTVEVTKSYHKLSRIYHPDKNPDNPSATKKFQRIAEAYQVLTDEAKRQQYDLSQASMGAFGIKGGQDENAVAFISEHSIPGRTVQTVEIEACHVAHLTGSNGHQLQQLRQQSGADLYVVKSKPMAQILVAGPPAYIMLARGLIDKFMSEISDFSGDKAPRDGVILLVPEALMERMQQQAMCMQHGASVRFLPDRIVLQGGMRVPQVVAQLQRSMDWSLQALTPQGHKLDAWSYAHLSESTAAAGAAKAFAGKVFQHLVPPGEPEPALVRKLLVSVLGLREEGAAPSPLVALATRALEHCRREGRHVTGALARAASCAAVHAEYAELSPREGAPLVCALHNIQPHLCVTLGASFASSPPLLALAALADAGADAHQGLALRLRAAAAVRAAVAADGKWHTWEEVAADSWFKVFAGDLRAWLAEKRRSLGVLPPSVDWLCCAPVLATLFALFLAQPRAPTSLPSGDKASAPALSADTVMRVSCDEEKGLRRPKASDARAEASGLVLVGPSVDDGRDEDNAGKLTLLELVEEVLLAIEAHAPVAVSTLAERTLAAALERGLAGAEAVSRCWCEAHLLSFELQADAVTLAPSARERAAGRLFERRASASRMREMRLAREVLPKLTAEGPPCSLRTVELASLLCAHSKPGLRVAGGLPVLLLRSLCRRGGETAATTPKELLHDASPFAPALLMRAIVAYEARSVERWDEDALEIVMHAAAINMHAVDDCADAPHRASLAFAADALWAAARRPFSERPRASTALLLSSAALRMQVELSEQAALSSEGSSFDAFAEMCACLAKSVVKAGITGEVKAEVQQAFEKLALCCDDLGDDLAESSVEKLANAIALAADDEAEASCEEGDAAAEALVAGDTATSSAGVAAPGLVTAAASENASWEAPAGGASAWQWQQAKNPMPSCALLARPRPSAAPSVGPGASRANPQRGQTSSESWSGAASSWRSPAEGPAQVSAAGNYGSWSEDAAWRPRQPGAGNLGGRGPPGIPGLSTIRTKGGQGWRPNLKGCHY